MSRSPRYQTPKRETRSAHVWHMIWKGISSKSLKAHIPRTKRLQPVLVVRSSTPKISSQEHGGPLISSSWSGSSTAPVGTLRMPENPLCTCSRRPSHDCPRKSRSHFLEWLRSILDPAPACQRLKLPQGPLAMSRDYGSPSQASSRSFR